MTDASNTLMWTPSAERVNHANMTRFMQRIQQEYADNVTDYASLWQWSVDNPELFWPEVWAFCGIKASKTWDSVLENGNAMPGAKWFPGAKLNFAENLLRYRDDRTALVFRDESGNRVALSYAELYREVARLAGAMRAMGIKPGDRVAAFMPNRHETVIAMLAATSCGAIWSSCSPDFGINGVLDRFGQIEPKLLFTCDGYYYNGKIIDSLKPMAGVLEKLDVERVVVIPEVNKTPTTGDLPNAMLWDDFLSDRSEIDFEQLPFDHPLYIMYSSGTTGVPKCIVHGAGGTLIQHLKEHVLHTDISRDDTLFYFTTCGWMMWNWLVSGLATGCTVVLYDGSPFVDGPEAMWKMTEEEGITVFGTSAKYIAAVEKADYKPAKNANLSKLKAILSTGSPLLPESYDFVYRDVKEDLQLSSISGGTDIVSCFALGNPILPVYKGELQCRGLGMKVEIYNENGEPVREEKGELVCSKPFPSMPIHFWNDENGERYHKAYFDRFDNTWCHGDYAELTEHDGVIIYGRSDATLNPGGVRIGTAEIYRQVEKLDEILESIAIGQRWKGDVRVVLFIHLREGTSLDDSLRDRIRKQIRSNTTPRHVPAKIVAVTDIPRTISGKIVELAVTHVVHGEPVKNTDALANPEALEQYREISELQTD
jgi:acetoacetyl-CoA synthetase